MAFKAVLDACALYPFSLRDTLLRLADVELYDAYWSGRILEEVRTNLVKRGVATDAQAAGLVAAMTAAFPGCSAPEEQVAALEPAMTNDSKDRHVLAAAKAVGAEAIVTFNLGDFPEEACLPLGVEAIHPDDFLLILWGIDPEAVIGVLKEQAADLQRPPMTLEELLTSLHRAVPKFADAVRDAVSQ
jgi:hypothetical protein